MPEVILCTYCDKPLDKDKDDYVVIRRASSLLPEVLAHVSCQQNQPKGLAEALGAILGRIKL